MNTNPRPPLGPPRLAEWLAAVRVPRERREFLLGDLDEEFRERVEAAGLGPARRWYWQQAWRAALTSRRGAGPAQATVRARYAFVPTLLQDVRFALRLFRCAPGHTAIVVLTLAIGIGATTAIFSVADAVVLRPLPYPHVDRMVRIDVAAPPHAAGTKPRNLTYSDILALQNLHDVFQYVGGTSQELIQRTVDGPEAESITGVAVSPEYFSVFGISAAAGRLFTSADSRLGAPPVVVLGHDYWRTRFHGDPQVVGRELRYLSGFGLGGTEQGLSVGLAGSALFATVVGVAPRSVGNQVDLWVPARIRADPHAVSFTSLFARLQSDISVESAQRVVDAYASIQPESPTAALQVRPFEQAVGQRTTLTMGILSSAVVLVLLTACVNVSHLQFSRGSTRTPELGVRAALGASRARIVRQLLTESVLTAAVGGVVGLGFAWLLLDWLVSILPISLVNHPRIVDVNGVVASASLALSITVGVLVGLWPALRLPGTKAVAGSLGPRFTATRRRGGVLLTVQVALALVLLSGAALMIRTFSRLHAVDVGFEPASHLSLDVRLATTNRQDREWYYPALLDRIRALPEIAAAGAVSRAARGTETLQVEGGTPHSPQPHWFVRDVLPGYFEAAGVRLIAGRLPTTSDLSQRARVVVASEAAARSLFGSEPAVGRRVILEARQPVARAIIGVVGDVRRSGPRSAPNPELYSLRTPGDGSTLALTLVVRPTRPTPGLPAALRSLASSLGPKILVPTIQTADEWFAETIVADRQRTLLLTVLGALALVIALSGILATTAHTVARRTHEIGVRMAIGARPAQVVLEIIGHTGRPLGAGLAIGLGGALLSTRAIASFLFETTPHDATALGGAVILLGLAGLLAAWWPARRAASIDPVLTLRSE